MHRIDGQNHLNNRFQGGDPIQRVDSTVVTPEWLNSVQEEIANAIEYFGLSLDKTNNQQLRDGLNRGIVPVGSIIPFSPGYFDGNANSNFQISGAAGNTVVEINNFLPDSWRVCDGTAPNDPESSIFNVADRFLPNLTDDRFLSGGTTSGNTGGANMRSLLVDNLPPHNHTFTFNPTDGEKLILTYRPLGAGPGTFHLRNNWSGIEYLNPTYQFTTFSMNNTGNGQAFDNRPSYLSCFYIIRIK